MDRRKTDRRASGAEAIGIDIETILKIVWKRKILIVVISAIIFIPGLVYILAKPSIYKATSTVVLEEQGINLGEFSESFPAQKWETADIDTQVKILTSPTLVRETLKEMAQKHNQDAPVDEETTANYDAMRSFLSNLSVYAQGKSRVISITLRQRDPYQAAEGVNTHAQEYINLQIRNKKEKVSEIKEWIAEQISVLKEDSQAKAKAIQEFRQAAGIIPGKNSNELIAQQILDLSEQLVPVESRKLALQARYESLGNAGNSGILPQEDSVVNSLRLTASQAKQELEALKVKYGPQHPEYIAAQNRYQQAMLDLGRQSSITKETTEYELKATAQEENLLRQRLEELNAEAGELALKQIALDSMVAEETASRALLESFIEKAEELNSQLAFERADARIDALAEIPTGPDGMGKTTLLALLILLSMVGGIGITFLLELLDRGIEEEEDIKKALNLPLLGILPKTKNSLDTTVHGAYLEAIKRFYLNLPTHNKPQSVLFTSAEMDEGKTSAVLNYARYLSSIKKKVLLVNADTIDPSIERLCDIVPAPGLADVLAGKASLAEVIRMDAIGLHILPIGNHAAAPVDFLAEGKFEKMLADLKEGYDHVLIDSSAVRGSTDSEALSRYVDKVILVIAHAKTPKARLKQVVSMLRQRANDVPGVILNKAP